MPLKNFIGTCFLLCSLILSYSCCAQCIQTVNFNTWESTGDSAVCFNAPWLIQSSGTELLSGCNTNFPTMFVGPDTLINVRVTGTFRVENYSDDDYIGFVFGFHETWDYTWTTGWMDHEYYLFDWKKNNQTYAGYSALEGFSLDKVNGSWNHTIPSVFPSFWVHTNSTAFTVLQTDYSTTNGWVPYTYYDFELLYTPTRAVILIDSDTIFDQGGCFEPGLFGFYNYSQEAARYLNFNYELYVDYQIESEHVCFEDTAKFFFIDTGGCAGANAFSNLDTFYWELGDGTLSTDTNPSHIYQYPDTFLVSLIATDINGCTDTMTKEIYIHPPAVAGIQALDGCYADSSQLLDSTYLPMGGNVVDWQWSMGDGLGWDTVQDPLYLYGSAGTYTVQLIIETNAGCVDTAESEIEVFGLPDVQFDYQNACEGFAVQLHDVSNATTFPIIANGWDVDNDSIIEYTGLNVNHTINNYGTYPIELIVTDSFGCRDSLTKIISVHPMPEPDFYVPGVCHNDQTQLIDSSEVAQGNITGWLWEYGDGNSFSYTGNNPPLPGPTHTYDNPGPKNVQLTITTDSGCVDSFTKTIQVYYLPVANFIADTVCDNENTAFLQTSYNQSGNLSYFKWEFGDGDSAFSATPMHNYTTPGEHVVTLTVKSNLGCADTVQKPIRVYPTPNTAFGWLNNVCEGDPLPFNDQSTIPQVTPGGDQIVAWQWVFNSSDSQSIQHPTYQTTVFEDIDVYLRTWSNHGCTTFDENTASIFPLPKASFTFNPACAEDSSKFTNTSKVLNGTIAETYWYFGDGGYAESEHPYHTYALPGTYSVTLVSYSNKGCVDSVTKEVVIPATPVASFDILPDEGCSPLRLNFANLSSLSTGSLSYQWFLDDSLFSLFSDPGIVIVNDTLVPTFHTVKLIATSDLGCKHTSTKEEGITLLPAPVAAFDMAEASYNMYNPLVQFHNQSRYGIRWKWTFGDGGESEDFAPSHLYTASGKYPVQQVVWNEYGCSDTARSPVSKRDGMYVGEQWHLPIDPITTVFIPQAFTPNGDGINDTWFVKGFNESKLFEIEIYNRWGELMFESASMNFKWDGLMPNSNKYAPNSSYVYQIRYMTSDDQEREVRGSFILAR
ncbi:MAG: PKD domain-containing protein [Cryomorphaceae bacterium]